MKKIKIIAGILAMFLLSSVALAGVVSAHSFRASSDVTVSEKEVVNDTIFVAGERIEVAGEVFGDVFCAGQNIKITGDIHGDLICAGSDIDIGGKIDGDIRVVGKNIIQTAEVLGNASIAGETYNLRTDGSVGQDLSIAVNKALINGSIERNIGATSDSIVVASRVGGNIQAAVNNLELNDGAEVLGSIDYKSANELYVDDNAVVKGDTIRTQVEHHRRGMLGVGLGFMVYLFLSLLLLALLLVLLVPKFFQARSEVALQAPFKTMLVGLLSSIAVPVAMFLLVFTVFGIPAAILLGLVWLVVALLSGPLAGYYLGRVILPNESKPVLTMLIGASVLLALYFIPVVMVFAGLFAYWLGAGMVVSHAFDYKSSKADKAPKPKNIKRTKK